MATCQVRFVLAALLVFSFGASGAPHEVLITAKDRTVAADAKQAMDEICKRIEDVVIDPQKGRDEINDALGGNNFVLTAMKEEKTPKALGERIGQEANDPAFIISAAYPIVLAVLTLIIYLICFWTACPCCKCCRANKIREPGPHSRCCKLIFGVALGVCLAGILGGGIATMSGYKKALTGFDMLQCQAATVLQTTLSGATDPYFIGILPIVQTIQDMHDSLDDGSAMMMDLGGIINSTETVTKSVTLVSQVLGALSQTLAMAGNMNPRGPLNGDLLHECKLCQDLSTSLDKVNTELTGGVASAMASVRSSIKDSLSDEKRQDMQKSLMDSSDSLLTFKNNLRDTFAVFVEKEGTFDRINTLMATQLQVIINVIFFWALLLFVFGCCSWCCWVKSESREGGLDFYRCPHRCGLCVWCCAFIPIVIGFIVAGVFLVISLPMAAVCDVMDKLDTNLLPDISPSLGIDLNGQSGEILEDMIDSCIVPVDLSMNPNMMKIIFTVDANGNKETVYNMTTRLMVDPINQGFNQLDKASASSPTSSLASSQLVTDLRILLSSNPMSAFYVPALSKLQADTRFSAMLADSSLSAAAGTSSRCLDHTPNGTSSSATIPGIASFNTLMDAVATGVAVPGKQCLKTYTCTSKLPACEGGRALMTVKYEMYSATAFKCVRFKKSDGSVCYMKNMTQDAGGKWQNDCLMTNGDGAMYVDKEWYDCNLAAFDQNVQDFDTLLDLAFKRLDATANSLTGTIGVDMKQMANTYMIQPAMRIVNGVTCGFMAKFYRGIVGGMCFSSTLGIRMVGKSYVTMCFFIIILTITVYWLWRRAIDNVNAQAENKKKGVQSTV